MLARHSCTGITHAFGKDAYPDLDAKAVALLHSIARNHALIDGRPSVYFGSWPSPARWMVQAVSRASWGGRFSLGWAFPGDHPALEVGRRALEQRQRGAHVARYSERLVAARDPRVPVQPSLLDQVNGDERDVDAGTRFKALEGWPYMTLA
jgi:hypothetical protein